MHDVVRGVVQDVVQGVVNGILVTNSPIILHDRPCRASVGKSYRIFVSLGLPPKNLIMLIQGLRF